MKPHAKLLIAFIIFTTIASCNTTDKKQITAADILGNPEYTAICYGGYRGQTRDSVPSVDDIKDDMRLLQAMNIKLVRTYNTKLKQVPNLLEAIKQLKRDDPNFEMYVMLGAWIDCKGAWTDTVDHSEEDVENNRAEIERAVKLAQQYPDIVKIIAVGNEAMVKWAASYYVEPKIILKWVNYLQDLKAKGSIPKTIWITSSDNFASWGGGDPSYHTKDLTDLLKAVDYVSLHTYPFHDTHYNSDFWRIPVGKDNAPKIDLVNDAMVRAKNYAVSQYQSTKHYIESLGIHKPIHIGETGWATKSNGFYGNGGSNAADEYKQKLYYDGLRKWSNANNITCFFFEAFDEQWKDASNSLGSENHFGLINLNGEAKYVIWDMVDSSNFNGLTRDGKTITKTFGGSKEQLMETCFTPPLVNSEK